MTAVASSELAGALRRWLASGELQSPSGAFCAWRDEATGELAFEYPEITGYALTCFAGDGAEGERGAQAAPRAADWLAERIEAGRYAARSGWDRDASYTFDLGMIAAGLINFGRGRDDSQAERLGRGLASILADLAVSPGGLAPTLPDGPGSGREPSWSNAGRAHLLKLAQCCHLAGRPDGAEALIASPAGRPRPDGLFTTQPDPSLVMLHPHFYAVEGSWIHAAASGDEAARDRARRATEAAWRHQRPDGALPRYVALDGSADGPGQCDVTAQAVRAAVLTSAEVDGLSRAMDLLARLARPAGGGAAMPYRASPADTDLNSWATMFAAQAAELHEGGTIRWPELV